MLIKKEWKRLLFQWFPPVPLSSMKGIDASYYYEGYNEFKTKDFC